METVLRETHKSKYTLKTNSELIIGVETKLQRRHTFGKTYISLIFHSQDIFFLMKCEQ